VRDLSKLAPDPRSLAQRLMSGSHVDGLSSEATTIVALGYSTIFTIVGVLILAATLTAWFLISKKDAEPHPHARRFPMSPNTSARFPV
jgi:hypothetical protein